MARTPLLRALRHLAREHHAAEQLGVTPGELRRRRAAGPSRRDFLKGAAALGVLTPAVRVLPARAAPPSIAIVGAGISGPAPAPGPRGKGPSPPPSPAAPPLRGPPAHRRGPL